MNLTQQETFLAVFGSVALLSAMATGIGQWALHRTHDPARLARLGVLNSRIRASWSVLAVFTIAFALGPIALLVVFALASFFALREFVSLTPIKSSDHWALVVAFYLVIPAQYILLGFGRASVFATFIPVYVFLLLPVVVAIRQDNERFLERIAKVQWGLMISVYCISHAPAIATLPIRGYEGRGPLLLLFFLLVLFLTDVLQIVFSAALGGRALRSNPNKTVNGVLAGSACGALVGTRPVVDHSVHLVAGARHVAGHRRHRLPRLRGTGRGQAEPRRAPVGHRVRIDARRTRTSRRPHLRGAALLADHALFLGHPRRCLTGVKRDRLAGGRHPRVSCGFAPRIRGAN